MKIKENIVFDKKQVLCIEGSEWMSITVGKIYAVEEVTHIHTTMFYVIINDNGQTVSALVQRFIDAN